MDINDNNDIDREESRRASRRAENDRKNNQKKQQQKPMQTFEAKLSEKVTHDQAAKESQSQFNKHLKEKQDEKTSLLDKILTKATSEQDLDGERIQQVRNDYDKKHEEGVEEFLEETSNKDDVDESEGEDKSVDSKSEKKGEIAEDGHKRVAEKLGHGGSGGQGGDSSGSGGNESGANTNMGGGGFQQQYGQDSKTNQSEYKNVAEYIRESKTLTPISSGDSTLEQGYEQNSKKFSDENLDEIVTAVHVGITEHGEEAFSVQLSDEYFEGLKIQSVRTEDGVVLKFICPNLQVRSTFLKYRPKVYQHFKSKNISVFRIDIV